MYLHQSEAQDSLPSTIEPSLDLKLSLRTIRFEKGWVTDKGAIFDILGLLTKCEMNNPLYHFP